MRISQAMERTQFKALVQKVNVYLSVDAHEANGCAVHLGGKENGGIKATHTG